MEIWLSNLENIPVNDPISGQLTYASFDLDQLVIIHREPRILILSVGLCGEAVTFICIYAPHQKYGTQAVIQFWEHAFSLINDLEIDLGKAVLPGDFNLRFGSLASNAVGKFAAQKQSPGAKSLHSWMTLNGFFFPSTFEKYHDTSSPHTYTHSSGSKHRIDYVLLNNNAQKYPCVCGTVDLDFNSVNDHIGV